jgi:ribosomal-protein-alanine N-acetyltransferase
MLRKLRASDIDALFKLFSNPQVTRYYDLETFHSPEQARQLLESFHQRYVRQIGLRWAIALSDNPQELIGTCGYNIWIQAADRAVLGYDLSPAFWRRGIMSEALAAVLAFGFDQMQLNRVEALSFPDNSAGKACSENTSACTATTKI